LAWSESNWIVPFVGGEIYARKCSFSFGTSLGAEFQYLMDNLVPNESDDPGIVVVISEIVVQGGEVSGYCGNTGSGSVRPLGSGGCEGSDGETIK
jgi:hypothetical protein